MQGCLSHFSAKLGELPVAAVVAGFIDQRFGFGEIADGEMVVGEVELHAGAGGDAKDFVEIAGRAAGEEGARKVVECPRTAEEVDGLFEVMSGFG